MKAMLLPMGMVTEDDNDAYIGQVYRSVFLQGGSKRNKLSRKKRKNTKRRKNTKKKNTKRRKNKF